MKTNYPLDKIVRRKNEERRMLVISIAILGIVTLLMISSSYVRSGLSGLVVGITRPLWVLEDNTLVLGGDMFKFLRSHKGLVEENRQLKEKIFQLQADAVSQKLIVSEYAKLSAVFGRVAAKDIPILGKVIVKPGRSPYDVIIVDVGADGNRPVKVGDVAKIDNTITIGQVTAVAAKTATIKLFSSPAVTTEVLVGANRLQATVTGRGGGNMLLVLPKGSEVGVGDKVSLPISGLHVIGIVRSIINDPNDPAQKMIVSLPINIFNLSWIEIYEP